MMSHLKDMTKFDYALNAAFSLALTALNNNDNVGFGIFSHKPLLFLKPKRGNAQLKTIMESCVDIKAQNCEADYINSLLYFTKAVKERSLIVLLTDVTDEISSSSLIKSLSLINAKHLSFCATLYDQNLVNLAKPNLITFENSHDKITQLFKRATSINVLSDRQMALSKLKMAKCMVLDTTISKPYRDYTIQLDHKLIMTKA